MYAAFAQEKKALTNIVNTTILANFDFLKELINFFVSKLFSKVGQH